MSVVEPEPLRPADPGAGNPGSEGPGSETPSESAREAVPEPERWLRPFDDRFNPILVKEVRQALHGKLFRGGFLLVLAIVMVTTTALIVDMGATVSEHEGRGYFVGAFFCLCVATLGLVPLSAYLSMGAEWDENTYDLLVLSNLKPRQIVLGKLLSSVVQSLLFFSAFAPFLCFAFLLRGVDLVAALVVLAGSLLLSAGLATLALMLSTFTRARFARVFVMGGLVALLVFASGMSTAGAEEILRSPTDLGSAEAPFAFLAFVLGVLLVSAAAFTTACNIIAHSEENRSSGLRVVVSVFFLSAMGLIAAAMGSIPDREVFSVLTGMLVFAFALPCIFFVTEREEFGRRTVLQVPRRGLLALLAMPWLPGGGRGALYLALHLFALFGFTSVGHLYLRGAGEGFFDEGWVGAPLFSLYVLVWLLLPPVVLARVGRGRLRPAIVRIAIPVFFFLCAFLPALLGFFIGDDDMADMEHVGHPFWIADRWWENRGFPPLFLLPAAFAFLTLVLNLPRMGRGAREVARASAARRQRERSNATTETPPDAVPES